MTCSRPGRPATARAVLVLGREFFARPAPAVAPDLIGCGLSYKGRGGVIVETECYTADDPACHGFNGMTERNRRLFGPPGTAYVYRSYGIHELLNFVTDEDGVAAAVLIRAIEPLWGLPAITQRRPGRTERELCAGPGRLTRALGITLADDGANLNRPPFLITAPPTSVDSAQAAQAGPPAAVVAGPRIGISKATERPWRFCAKGSRYLSRPGPA